MSSEPGPTPPKKPLFKKKVVKGASTARRVKLDFDDQEEAAPNDTFNVKKSKSKHLFVKNSGKAAANVSKWKVREPEAPAESPALPEIDGVTIADATEGSVLTGAELEELEEQPGPATPKPEPKFVPQLQDSIEHKVSARSTLTDLAHEYDDENDYDQIHDEHATIDPEPANDLQLDQDDDMVDAPYDVSQKASKIDSTMYDVDIEIGNRSDAEADFVQVVHPLTLKQEVDRLDQLMSGLKLQHEAKKAELLEYRQQLPIIQDRKTRLLENLNSI